MSDPDGPAPRPHRDRRRAGAHRRAPGRPDVAADGDAGVLPRRPPRGRAPGRDRLGRAVPGLPCLYLFVDRWTRRSGIDERRSLTSGAEPAGPSAYLPARWPPLLYFGFAHACLATAFAVAAWRPAEIAGFYYHPRLIALVHLVTLGWISSSILGALYLVGPLTFRITLPGTWRDVMAFAVWVIAVTGLLPTSGWSHWTVSPGLACLALPAMMFVGLRVLRRLPSAPVPFEARLPVMLALVNMMAAALLGVAPRLQQDASVPAVSQLERDRSRASRRHRMGNDDGDGRRLPHAADDAALGVTAGPRPFAATILTQAGTWLLVGRPPRFRWSRGW